MEADSAAAAASTSAQVATRAFEEATQQLEVLERVKKGVRERQALAAAAARAAGAEVQDPQTPPTSESEWHHIATPPQSAETIETELGTMTKKEKSKKAAAPLNEAAKVGPDSRDPRYKGSGPCGALHKEFVTGGNQWGTWKHCAKCDLRMEYVPRANTPANSTQCFNPASVESAFEFAKAAGLWETMDHKTMKALIKISQQLRHVPGTPVPLTKEAILKRVREPAAEAATKKATKAKAGPGKASSSKAD